MASRYSGQYGSDGATLTGYPPSPTRERREKYGASKLTAQHVWNVLLSKFVNVGQGRFQLAFEVFNLFNVNDILRIQQVSGRSFGNVLENIPPRIARVSATFDF